MPFFPGGIRRTTRAVILAKGTWDPGRVTFQPPLDASHARVARQHAESGVHARKRERVIELAKGWDDGRSGAAARHTSTTTIDTSVQSVDHRSQQPQIVDSIRCYLRKLLKLHKDLGARQWSGDRASTWRTSQKNTDVYYSCHIT